MAAGRFEVSLRVSTLKRNFVSPRGYLMSPIYSETEFLIIGTERQLSKVSVDKIKIGQAEGIACLFSAQFGHLVRFSSGHVDSCV